jgi:hypothetical protein
MSAAVLFRLRLGLAVLLAVLATGLAIALAVPTSLPLSSWAPPVPMTVTSEARAVAAANENPPDLEAVERYSRATLAVRPGEPAAWARLAWAAAERGDLAEANEALDRTYTVAPYGPDITAWRLRFAFGRWQSLTPELRARAVDELSATYRTRYPVAEAALADITDPAGRLAFTFTRNSALADQG